MCVLDQFKIRPSEARTAPHGEVYTTGFTNVCISTTRIVSLTFAKNRLLQFCRKV